MDKRAAAQYLDQIFSHNQGYVAVAYKDKDSSWQESQFSWPTERDKLLGWAHVHSDANVFICPALRNDPHTRKKGDARPTRWLWADVDWQGVPQDKRDEVQARIKELGTLVIRSGSGENVHVYVQLSKAVDSTQHAKLNTGLRDYLYGDNKQADNSLLRLPGTMNWKTPAGSLVRRAEGVVRSSPITPDALMRRRAFRDAKVIADADNTEWDYVEVEGLSHRLLRKVQMPVEQALGIYGKRHAAVWAVTKDLIRYNLDPDEIHSLMDKFPPGIDKMAEENGYDVHRDVAKCLAAHRVVEQIAPDLTPDEVDDVLQPLTEDEEKELNYSELEQRANRIAFENEARKLAKDIEAKRSWVAPPQDVSWSISGSLTTVPPPAQYLIGVPPNGKRGLCGIKHNVIITAQYKTGKTKFIIATVAKALCDGEPFMGSVPVHTPEGGVMVGHWNCEMDPDEMAADYVHPAGITNLHNLDGVDLRGHRVNLLSDYGKQWAIEWLKSRQVKVWTIDSLARLARMAGVSEKDNDEMFDLLMAIDEVKVQAGVDVVFLITHTGRAVQEEGKERARGATAIDDWCDARWVMTNEGGTRFLAVDGRGVGMEGAPLVYNEETGHSDLGYGGREDVKADGAVQLIVRLVKDSPGITQSALFTVLKNRSKLSQRVAAQYIQDAVDGDYIEIRGDSSGRGKTAKRHYLRGYEKPEGDRFRRATPADVDMRPVKARSGRRKLSV